LSRFQIPTDERFRKMLGQVNVIDPTAIPSLPFCEIILEVCFHLDLQGCVLDGKISVKQEIAPKSSDELAHVNRRSIPKLKF